MPAVLDAECRGEEGGALKEPPVGLWAGGRKVASSGAWDVLQKHRADQTDPPQRERGCPEPLRLLAQ